MKRNFKSISYLLIGLLLGSLIPISSIFASTPIKLIINNQEISCDSPPQLINGRVMVPARNVAENLGGVVSWDATNNAVVINSTNTQPSSTQSSNQNQINNTNTSSFPEAQNIKGNIKKVYVNPTIEFNSSTKSYDVISSQTEFDNGYFLMMYGKYSNMGNNFMLLDGVYKSFPTIANELKKELGQMDVKTYQNKEYVSTVNLIQFLRLHYKTVRIEDINDNSVRLEAK